MRAQSPSFGRTKVANNSASPLVPCQKSKGSVVTSGDYQRGYLVNGAYYHHIIDPETLFPARLYRAVTVVCESSSLADALSTALFLLPMDEGQALLDKCNAEAVWIDMEGKIHYSPAFQKLIRT